jgi:hypothetical protein
MKSLEYYSMDEIRYISLGILAEKILRKQGIISNLIELQERLIETTDHHRVIEIYNLVNELDR